MPRYYGKRRIAHWGVEISPMGGWGISPNIGLTTELGGSPPHVQRCQGIEANSRHRPGAGSPHYGLGDVPDDGGAART